jgi:hypothetical protein
MSIPQDLMMQADAIGAGMDAANQQGMQMMAPQGKYSARAMNALVAVLNDILPMMQEQPYPEFTEDQVMFPQDLMQVLMAIMTIAEQAGIPVEISLSEVVSDADVAKLVALLKRAVNDKKFKDFLAGGEEEEVTEETTTEELPLPEGGEMEVSDEELFASRMR